MDEKLNETLMGVWDSLTDTQRKKARACKTMDELLTLAGKEGIELPDEMLDAVAGGSYYPRAEGGWYIIDDMKGETQTVITGDESLAVSACIHYGFDRKRLTPEEFKKYEGC